MKFDDIVVEADVLKFFELNTPDINLKLCLKDTFTKQLEEARAIVALHPEREIILGMRAAAMGDYVGYSFTLKVDSFMRGIFAVISGTFIVNLALLDENTKEIFESPN